MSSGMTDREEMAEIDVLAWILTLSFLRSHILHFSHHVFTLICLAPEGGAGFWGMYVILFLNVFFLCVCLSVFTFSQPLAQLNPLRPSFLLVMPRFAEQVEVAIEALGTSPPQSFEENEFIDASRLVYDGVRDIRKAVLMIRVSIKQVRKPHKVLAIHMWGFYCAYCPSGLCAK